MIEVIRGGIFIKCGVDCKFTSFMAKLFYLIMNEWTNFDYGHEMDYIWRVSKGLPM